MLYREAGQFRSTYAEDQQIFPIRQDRIAMAALLVVAFVAVPLFGDQYWLSAILTPFLIFALAALGLNILTGYAGQLSLGTAAFMGIGAFMAYNAMLRVPHMPIVGAFIVGGLCAAAVGIVFGIPMMKTKLLAFAISSFYCGVAGALYAYTYLGTVEPEAFTLDISFRVLFMIIIGGVGSILGSFLGAAFITLFPIFLNLASKWLENALGIEISHALVSNSEAIIFGGLIIFFLIVEPNGLARLWQITKEKLRLWPFPH